MMTKLTKELIEGIYQAVREDMPNEAACQLFGIGETSFYHWKKLGLQDIREGVDSLYADFWKAIKKAEAEAIQQGVNLIKKAGEDPKHWPARSWLLERGHRKYFSAQGDVLEKLESKIERLENLLLKISEGKSIHE